MSENVRVTDEYCDDKQQCHLARLEGWWKCCKCEFGPNRNMNYGRTRMCTHEVCGAYTKTTWVRSVGNRERMLELWLIRRIQKRTKAKSLLWRVPCHRAMTCWQNECAIISAQLRGGQSAMYFTANFTWATLGTFLHGFRDNDTLSTFTHTSRKQISSDAGQTSLYGILRELTRRVWLNWNALWATFEKTLCWNYSLVGTPTRCGLLGVGYSVWATRYWLLGVKPCRQARLPSNRVVETECLYIWDPSPTGKNQFNAIYSTAHRYFHSIAGELVQQHGWDLRRLKLREVLLQAHFRTTVAILNVRIYSAASVELRCVGLEMRIIHL
jgi:hypothetical protein